MRVRVYDDGWTEILDSTEDVGIEEILDMIPERKYGHTMRKHRERVNVVLDREDGRRFSYRLDLVSVYSTSEDLREFDERDTDAAVDAALDRRIGL